MSDEPQVYIDVEARFTSGHLVCLSLLDGRDRLLTDGTHLTIELNPTPESTDITILERARLDYLRTTRRVVTPEPIVTDAGSLKVTGPTPTA